VIDRLRFAHLDDLGRLTRRLLRQPSVARELFFQAIDDPAERTRLGRIAAAVRGADAAPAVFLHGVQPRSGTNYVSTLLDQHPDVVADPMGVHELPLLMMLDDVGALQRRFIMRCEANRAAFDRYDFVALIGNGLVAAAERSCVPGQRLVFRSPHCHMLSLFPVFFPNDLLIVLMRDGRDVIASTQATWRSGPFGKTFKDLCLEWTYSAQAALDAVDQVGRQRCRLIRYEDVVQDPQAHFDELCRFMQVDPALVERDRLAALPVKGSSEASVVGNQVSWQPIAKPERFNPIGRWRNWSARQQRTFWSIAGETMARAGYQP
jgi:protein-tyrosine sulfotransferase